MTSPPGGGSEYIADHEHSAYEQGKQEYAGASNVPIIGNVLTDVLSKAKATAEASKYGQEQAKALSVDQELREKPGSLGNTHYLSFEHKEMDRFVRENFDPTAVHDVGRVYHGHGAKFLEFAEQIRQAATKTEHTWQGEAGDAMRKHVTQLADHMSHSGNAAQLTANQVGMQAEAAERARNSMPEVVEFDMKQELKNYFSDPNPFTALSRANDIVEKQEKSQAAHQEAAQVMSKMETDFGTAAAQTPAFVPAPRGPEEQPGTSEPSQNTIGSINPSSTPASTQSAWSGPNTSTPQYSPPSSPNVPPSSTNAVWQQSPPASPPSDTRWNPNTGQWERQNPYNGRWAPLPPNQQRPGPGGPGGGRPGGAGGMGGGRGGGPGGAGRVGGVGGGQLGAGGRAGIGGLGAAGGAGAGGAGAGGAAGGRGGAGMAGGGAAGRGQGGKSEEDDEHESKYVVDTDEAWDDLGLPKVAPPVFGE
ncbi:PPE domain-containing protein [Saccharopolyspora elongata]|uniref:PPE domain-containing protein n=1 Tax=Saccharopolyspora elongata TaxID=2530387 RepID=A0A4R4YUX1_9PSEU|nr:PPE domain-containing protein [Saccharopolyspora elongata]TDD49188.1 PPE domain-containing protein [Saccharopolyspora elongata]